MKKITKKFVKKFAILELFLILIILIFFSSLLIPFLKSNNQKVKQFEKECQIRTIQVTENIYRDLK